jgi:hypothetical protein
VWTFAYDVAGLERVEFKYRTDADGANSTASDQNETYAGGPEVGAWQTAAMTWRDFPTGNFFNDPNINFSVLPAHIADEYCVRVTGLSGVLIDYYVEAEDSLGNVKKSPIQHVWIGEANTSPSHVIDGVLDTTAALVASNGGLNPTRRRDGTYTWPRGVGALGRIFHHGGRRPATRSARPGQAALAWPTGLFLGSEQQLVRLVRQANRALYRRPGASVPTLVW